MKIPTLLTISFFSAVSSFAGTQKVPLTLKEGVAQKIIFQAPVGLDAEAIGFYEPINGDAECRFEEDNARIAGAERAITRGGIIPQSGQLEVSMPAEGYRGKCLYKLDSISIIAQFKTVMETLKITTAATVASRMSKFPEIYTDHPETLPEKISLSCEFGAETAGICRPDGDGLLPLEYESDLKKALIVKFVQSAEENQP